jgi:Flp pilus assembly protein TadG
MKQRAAKRNVKKRPRMRRVLKRMRLRSRKGSAALEFAMIAPILFVLLMGTIEMGVMYFVQYQMQFATTEAARLIRTGQAVAAQMTADQFRQKICDNIEYIPNCKDNLMIDVEAYNNFGTVAFNNPLNADGQLNPGNQPYSVGDVCNVVVVRSFYAWKVMTPVLTPFMINMADQSHLLTAAAAFRNEPYNTTVSGC